MNILPHILIIGPSWVGDMVLAQSLFKIIKMQNPEAIIDVAAPNWTLPLLDRMTEVNRAIALPFKHGQLAVPQRLRYGRSLRNEGYTQAIVLTNSFKSALLPWAANIPQRTGYLGECRYGFLNDIRLLDKARLPRTVDRFVALGMEAESRLPDTIPEPRIEPISKNAETSLRRLGHQLPQTPVLGLCPGAEYGPAKRWPSAHFAEVAGKALGKGWEVWLFGSDKDIPVTSEINSITGMRCLDLGGKTTLGEAIDLMSLTHAVVSNDSGLMHLAAALDKPLVAIYGSSDPQHTPPMNANATISYLGLSCSPCFKRTCPFGHMNCLNRLYPEHVIGLLSKFEDWN